MLSALVLKEQGIDVTWVGFETPFFSAKSAANASKQTGIPLIIRDITEDYMEMLKNPRAGYGKNMNPCMDCHALMFNKAGLLMKELGFDFLFSGEVVGQRPKSQTKNSLRYVEKNSGMDGYILRPLSARCLPETLMEKEGLVNRDQLLNITGRSRKIQMQMAENFGILEYPSPAGGCLLTDVGFSRKLKDLMDVQGSCDPRLIRLLKHGRHFRLNTPEEPEKAKLVVGKSNADNKKILALLDPQTDLRFRHAFLPGPEAVLTGEFNQRQIETAASIVAAYSKAETGTESKIRLMFNETERIIPVLTRPSAEFRDLMI